MEITKEHILIGIVALAAVGAAIALIGPVARFAWLLNRPGQLERG